MNVSTGTNNFGAWNRFYTGDGTLLKTGTGTLDFGGYGSGNANVDFSAGALIHVAAGTLLAGHPGIADGVWTSNYASLTLDSNTLFDMSSYNVQVDALNGAAYVHDTKQWVRCDHADHGCRQRRRHLRRHD